jgi:hypothetical protein
MIDIPEQPLNPPEPKESEREPDWLEENIWMDRYYKEKYGEE